ncbi:GNAT family N-acetyltransferase [Bacteriovorax sp. PP10]|uniref:GNAT family N-acetyltransferase n=1 Tax=Bacteriovorax antarcticus TaxID=3088717 RepID=A0ABU5W0C3_9BACT|nr:GNAT family N-acetyltransferase [Bacteriovorax sp. PP10]MEA9358004.1 GNAT family N-acetyltransferase [Bacteriovorax sp. PP10]
MSEVISLIKMTEDEFNVWCKRSIENYRDEHIKNGLTFAEAQKRSDDDFGRLLPDGVNSVDQHVFTIKENGSKWIGTLWFGVRGAADNRKAFIYDIILDDETRGKGYGKKAMQLLEDEVKKVGLRHIGLHVFGHNKIARSLYEKLGYETTNVNMEKTL